MGQLLFDISNVLTHIQNLSGSRLAGSEGERKADNYIRNYLRSLNYNVIVQKFSFSSSLLLIPKLVNFTLLFLISIQFVLIKREAELSWLFSIFVILLMCIFIAAKDKLHDSNFGRNILNSKNVIATNNDYKNNGKINLIFLAHYDSISYPLNGLILIVLKFISRVGILLISLFGVINKNFSSSVLFYLLFFSVVSSLLLLCLNSPASDNKSMGIIDNASGVGVLLELARIFKTNYPKSINLIFMTTGAEEVGFKGIKNFIKEYKAKLSRDESYFVNLDCLGSPNSKNIYLLYNAQLKDSNRALNLNILSKRLYDLNVKFRKIVSWFGPWDENFIISKYGFKGLTITQVAVRDFLLYTHCAKDTLDRINLKNLGKIGRLCNKISELIQTT